MVKLQEVPDSIPEGETPHSVCLFAYDGLIDYPQPGDCVVVTGILTHTHTKHKKKLFTDFFFSLLDRFLQFKPFIEHTLMLFVISLKKQEIFFLHLGMMGRRDWGRRVGKWGGG